MRHDQIRSKNLKFNFIEHGGKLHGVMHCGLRGYENAKGKKSLFEHKSWNFLTKRAIFSMLPKKFSKVLINGFIFKRAALV